MGYKEDVEVTDKYFRDDVNAESTRIHTEEMDLLQQAMNQLPLEKREILVLSKYQEMLLKEDVNYEEELSFEELESDVKIFNSKNELIAEGNTQDSEVLRKLVNKANLLSENQGKK